MTTRHLFVTAVFAALVGGAALAQSSAADGKSRTSTTKGTDIKGQPLNVESVYEKQ